MSIYTLTAAVSALLALSGHAFAQASTRQPLAGTLERITVPGPALEGNLLAESAAPHVSVYLPPSYQRDRERRYPVIYLLHGYGSTDLTFLGPTAWTLEV